jgi:hypothetical protein
LDTNLTATVLQMVLLLGPEAHEREVSVAAVAAVVVAAASVGIADQAVVTETIDEVEAVGMIADPAVPTTNPSAAETDHGTVVERVGMVETTARESVATKATATTIQDNEGGIEHGRWLQCASVRVCQGYLPFFRLMVSRQ